MKIKSETRTTNLTLRIWRGGWNAGYEPDCFDDLEPNVPDYDNDADAILMPETELTQLIKFWQAECDAANHGEDGDVLQGLTAEELERGDGWYFAAEEMN